MVTSNPVVAKALNAVARNAPWSGNLYKCPKCRSMREFSREGECRKCHYKMRGSELGKFLTERITREARQRGKNPITGLRTTPLTGPVDLFAGDVKHMQAHAGALKRLGMTLGAGRFGKTTVGSIPGRPVSKDRVSFVDGRHVAFTQKYGDKKRSKVTTHFAGRAAGKRELELHKETRRK